VNTENALKLLFELRATLGGVQEYDLNDQGIYGAIAGDIERAIALADECISQLADEDSPGDGDENA
jgi:hypothetical protein